MREDRDEFYEKFCEKKLYEENFHEIGAYEGLVNALILEVVVLGISAAIIWNVWALI